MAGATTGHGHKQFMKIIVLGDSSVGKTSLMLRFMQKEYTGVYKATIGADFLINDIVVNGRPVSLQVWDTAGQERFAGLGTSYYRGADACILVFDVTVEASFHRLTFWKEQFLHHARIPQKCRSEFPFLVVANKIDEPVESHAVARKTVEDWCREDSIPYIECSAKEATNVDQAFDLICSRVLKLAPQNAYVLLVLSSTLFLTFRRPPNNFVIVSILVTIFGCLFVLFFPPSIDSWTETMKSGNVDLSETIKVEKGCCE